MISWWRTSFGEAEIQKLRESIALECISQGPVAAQFEAELASALGVPYAVTTTSGSVALLLAMMALGIGRDDEVIVPNRTWIATAHAALFLGAKVKLVDVLADVPIMDVRQIRRLITTRTKAIVPVHINGRAVDMAEIQKVAEEYGLVVIEDACQALFSKNSAGFLGTQSDAGCFSLGVTKLVSTGQGGVILTGNSDTYEKLKLLRNHGVADIFTDTWNQLGFNFKFTDLQASLGLVQLSRAPERIKHLHSIYAKYEESLAEIPFLRIIPVNTLGSELPLYVEVLCSERRTLIEFLKDHGIQARPSPPSLHTSSYLCNPHDLPRSDIFAEEAMYLPCGPEQPLENVERVVEGLRLYGKQRMVV